LVRKKAQWLNVDVEAEVTWDYDIFKESLEQGLVKKALNGSLDKLEEIKLMEALKSDPELIKEWGIGGNEIPILVETNIELSYQILCHLNNYPVVHE